LELLTRWVLRHKAIVVVAWAVLAVAGFVSLPSLTSHLDKTFKLPGREGYDTNEATLKTYGNGGQVAPSVPVITLPASVTVNSPGVTAALARAFDGIPPMCRGSGSPHTRAPATPALSRPMAARPLGWCLPTSSRVSAVNPSWPHC
jgi:RND superfamily putative drug exporter